MATGQGAIPCTVVLHDDTVSHEDVLCGINVLPTGAIGYLVASSAKPLWIHASNTGQSDDEVSIHVSVAKIFGFGNRMNASVRLVEETEAATATHVEVFFRDQHLSRADMWRTKDQVDASVLYRGQKLNYLGTTTASVEAIYISGQQVDSAFASHPQTKLIFRSGSARYMILVQISKEMLEYWRRGDLLYESLVTGFLPELFRRWDELKVRHQISMVLFGRRLPPVRVRDCGTDPDDIHHTENDDFFRVITSNMPSGDWRALMAKLRRAFNDAKLSRPVCLAAKGNMLEAIHISAMDFARDNIDPHLASTGTSIIAITAGAGLFEADQGLLKRTTDVLMGNSTGVDIVSLSPKPLHPVPLFQYIRNGSLEYALPHWADVSYWKSSNDISSSTWLFADVCAEVNSISIAALEEGRLASTAKTLHAFDEEAFGVPTMALGSKRNSLEVAPSTDSNVHLEMANDVFPALDDGIIGFNEPNKSVEQPRLSSPLPSNAQSLNRSKRESLPPHPLLQMGRNVSLGAKSLAPSQGVVSTTISAQHALHDIDSTVGSSFPTNETASGLAKQIRESLRRNPSHQVIASPLSEPSVASEPIEIQNGEESKHDELSDPATLIEKSVMEQSGRSAQDSGGSHSATPKAHIGRLLLPKASSTDDQNDSTSPWLTLLNPSNPGRDNMKVASEYRQWQNVFPSAVSSGAFKWDSMCTPALLPLMTERIRYLTDLERTFKKKVRRLVATSTGAHQIMLQMIAIRLAEGFQIVPMRRLPHAQMPSEQIDRMLLLLGGRYHELRCLSNAEVQVSEYERQPEAESTAVNATDATLQYLAKVKPAASGREYSAEIRLRQGETVTDWAPLDDQSVNPTALTESLGSSRMRFVLIPVELPRTEVQNLARSRELSDEERRIDGIQRLTQMWQRHRYFSDEDQRHHSSMIKPKTSNTVERDPNPLAIEYQTRDPTAVVSTYGTNLSNQLPNGETIAPLFAESERYHSSNFDVAKLVKHMQEPVPNGVEVRDRRWFTRLHLKCFRGDEMTNWLLGVFKDLQTREDAVALGNQLRDQEIFTHVRGKHEFRDGNYFYQIKSAHRTTDYPDTAGLFGRGIGRSVPSTPISDFRHSPTVLPARDDSDSSGKGTPTPTLAPVDRNEKKEVLLSQMLQYNVDSTKKSTQLEIVNLHYDRIHNPVNCYHIQLDWTSTTAKLIRDSVTRWTSLVESQGLRLVQLPTKEACKLHEQHPLDQAIPIKLAVRPPDRILVTPQLDPHSFSPRLAEDPNGYHKALLRKLDFVLDFEAATSFSRNLDVRYSWGRPDYELTQFVHKSGLLLAQISNDGKSDFLVLPNRLVAQSTTAASKKTETNSAENIVQKLTTFCRDQKALQELFEEVNNPKVSVPSPFTFTSQAADNDVPPMELPAHLLHRVHKQSGTNLF